MARAVAEAAGRSDKPVLACFLGRLDVADELERGGPRSRTVPAFAFPEAAARALGRAAQLAAWRSRPEGRVAALDDVDAVAARQLVTASLERADGSGRWLDAAEADTLLRSFGIPTVEMRRVRDAAGAVSAATELGGPVVLKVGTAGVVHKTEVEGVALNLDGDEAVRGAFDAMHARFGDEMDGAVVQRMAPSGLEVIVGITQDPLFGPLLLFGLGGVTAELLADRALRILPITDEDAHELVRSLRTSPLLFGYRGSPPLDVAALEDVIARVARLAEDVSEISEMDLNPVIVGEHGVTVIDAKVRCAQAPVRLPPDLRRTRD
jgi:acyl-CoA synthetase (NDP forming)